MVEVGTIKTVKKEGEQLLCTVSLASGEKTAVFYSLPGIETYPLKGDVVSIKKTQSEYVIESIFIPGSIKPGEVLIYSRSPTGVTQATIKGDDSGNIILNDGSDFAVKYNELKKAFDQLKNDFNSFVNATFNAHTHICAAPGAASVAPLPLGTPTAADMTSSKVDKVKL